jgi:hypothetical protein
MSVQIFNASTGDRRRASRLSVLLALVVGLPVVSAAASVPEAPGPATVSGSARPGRGDGSLRSLADRQVSMDEAVDMAQRRYNARVVRAEVSDRGGRRVYLLRLLSDDGRVFNVRVDAATGNIQ